MADLGTAVIPQTVGVLPDAEASTDYTFRRYNYGIAVSTYPLLAVPRGTNPAL